MRKVLVLFVILLLGLSIAAVAGCGSSEKTEETKNYEEKVAEAQALFKEAELAWQKLDAEIEAQNTSLTGVVMGAMAGSAPTAQQGLSSEARALMSEADQVKALYEVLVTPEMKQSKGTEAYATYAEAMIAALDANKVVMDMGANFLARIEPDVASGNQAAVQAAIEASTAEITQIQDAQKKADEAVKAAEEIKSQQGLGEE